MRVAAVSVHQALIDLRDEGFLRSGVEFMVEGTYGTYKIAQVAGERCAGCPDFRVLLRHTEGNRVKTTMAEIPKKG